MAEFGARRVRDTPIAEAAIIGVAIGAAMTGLRPVAELMTLNFGIVAMDQIINHASKARYMFGGQVNLPMVIRAAAGGGTQKGAQHSHSIESWFVNAPGIRVVIPSTPYDLKGLLKTAIRCEDPVLFIEHEMLYNTKGEVPDEEYLLPFGVADVKRPGPRRHDRRLVEDGARGAEGGRDAGRARASRRRSSTRARSTRSTWTRSSARVMRTRRAVIVEEGWRKVGVGAEIASQIHEALFYELEAPVQRVGAADVPTPYASNLEKLALPDAQRIVDAVLKITL